jgi:Rrf2 family protein
MYMIKLSAKTEYACRALLELSLHWPNVQPLSISQISERRKIPQKFLIQILLLLKQAKIVESTRGKEGGYILSKSPAEISFLTVSQIFSDFKDAVQSGKKSERDVVASAWNEAAGLMIEKLRNFTFDGLVKLERERVKTVMYSI